MRAGKYISIALFVAFWASPALAEEDGDNSLRFSADDFINEYNLYLGSNTAKEKDKSITVDLKVNFDDTDLGKDFVYFKKEGPNDGPSTSLSLMPSGTIQTTFGPRNTKLTGPLESLTMPSGEGLALSTFTPRYTGADVSFSIGQKSDGLNSKQGVSISLSSQITQRSANVFSGVNNIYADEALKTQIYDVGVNVGYSNFFLGASVRGEEGAFYDGISGYDVGLSYERPTWSTSILFGEYRQDSNLITTSLNSPYLDTRFFAMEFGAAYKLAPWFRFVGSFRMYEDPDLFLFDNDRVAISRMFYLGTRVNF